MCKVNKKYFTIISEYYITMQGQSHMKSHRKSHIKYHIHMKYEYEYEYI